MLKSYTSKLLDINIDSIEDALVSLVLNKSVYVDRNDGMSKIYLSSFYHAELGVCRKLVELSQVRYSADMEDFEERIKQVQKKEGIILADKQKEAIREAMTNGVLVITGGRAQARQP